MNRYASDRAMSAPSEPSVPRQVDTPVPPMAQRSEAEWLQEAERRLRGYRPLLETLTEEDWEFFRNYDGPEVLGPPPPLPMKRRPRRRGEP